MYLLLGRLIGKGGFAEVYQAFVVEVMGNASNLQAYQYAAAAGAKGLVSPAVLPYGNLSFAVKVYNSSKAGVSDSSLAQMAACELHALQLLRGWQMVVQIMAEGELVFTPSSSAHISSVDGLAGGAGGLAAAVAAGGGSVQPYQPRCVVLELAEQPLSQLMQGLVRADEHLGKAVAIELLKLLLVSQSGELGYYITHRDLKPANLLMFASGRLAVADFGVCHIASRRAGAAAAAAAAGATSMHTVIGTPFYAAPELWLGGGAAAIPAASPQYRSPTAALGGLDSQQQRTSSSGAGYDSSVDVFALGVIVLEMLVGRLSSLFGPDKLTIAQMMQQWQQRLQEVVDGVVPLPNGVVLSAAALQFIGCCCGVGREREAAAARGEPKRLTPEQLCDLPFIVSFSSPVS
jgi:serine/threonine protein kinase